jgi:parallel beta-helix repeat protein
VLDLPEVARGEWVFHSLFVNGQRRARPRLPKSDWFWIEDVPGKGLDAQFQEGSSQFIAKKGDLQPWKNLTDVEVVALHFWVDEHMPITSFDKETGLVTSSRRSILCLKDDLQAYNKPRFAKYYVQNVFEALTEPGEWYLDRRTGRLYYLPMEGESPENTEVFAPQLTEILAITGEADANRLVQNLCFVGLTFRHTDAVLPRGGWDPRACSLPDGVPAWPKDVDYAGAPQAAFNLPGAIRFEAARGCTIEDCRLEHLGWYAVEIGDACSAIRIVGNEMCDLGGGGVKINGADCHEPRHRRTGNNVVTDNHIHHAGRVFHQAVGVFLKHTFGNVISHNHIHDLFYTGISCGWSWGMMETVSRDNHIEKNHIHHLGFGWLSDMGGIYTLGVQPGTVVRGNLIHDVERASYGGWGIYLDEGSSHIVVENNITYNTSTHGFYQNPGRENIVRNNIFASGRDGLLCLGASIPGVRAFTFQHNIVVSEGAPIHVGNMPWGDLRKPGFASDYNVLWNTAGEIYHHDTLDGQNRLTTEELRAAGLERHSVIADPLFKNYAGRDFTLLPDSPALALGFKPIDMSDAGPRISKKHS